VDNRNITLDNHNITLDNHNITLDKHNSALAITTVVGISLSITCLVLHLAIFLATPRLRKLPAMNLASLCVALLLLYTSFIARVFLKPTCVELAVTTHYSLLATFCWMLAISFEVCRAIRRSTRKLWLPSGERKYVDRERRVRVNVLRLYTCK
jgi:magnesium-transporting ATPase (P-type)